MCDCPYPSSRENHPVFVYLLSDRRFRADKHLQWIVPYIGVAANPFDDVRRQNREAGYSGADHTTKNGAGHLQLEIVIGPFAFSVAEAFRIEWRKKGRKLISRVQKGVEQARVYGKRWKMRIGIFCMDVRWVQQQIEALPPRRSTTTTTTTPPNTT